MFTQRNKFLPYLMWLLPLIFFAYQFILRLWPGLMMHQIMDQFSIDASHFGLIAAVYYYGYAGMQIPVAILLDKCSARYVIFAFAVLCGLASLMFTFVNNFYLALLSRFLIGAGSAVGFLGVSKVISEWFPKDQYARMVGFTFTFGLLGAIYGGKPVSLLIEAYSWQAVALTLALVSMTIGCLTYIVLRTPTNTNAVFNKDKYGMLNFKSILTSPLIWGLAIANLLMVGSLEGFADVWGIQYLMLSMDLNKGDAAGLISFIFFGMLFGGPLLALLSKKFGNYTIISLCGLGMALAFIYLLIGNISSTFVASGLFFVIGVMCCYQVIVFAVGVDLVTPQNFGVTVAFLNCINMLGGSFFHTLIGLIMDKFWKGEVGVDGVRVYDIITYQIALGLIPICAVLGALIIFAVAFKAKRDSYS